MQELEKILEEIEARKKAAYESKNFDGLTAFRICQGIICKYMNGDNEIVEMCPHCENEAALHWDVEKDGYEAYCPYCGFPIMMCSVCDARDGAVCDWEEEKGCKHSSERYRDYFCKKHMGGAEYPYIIGKDIEADPPASKEFLAECREAAKKYGKNDGLILVSERMPDNSYYCEVTFGDGRRGIAWYSDIIGMWLAKFK